MWNPIEWLAWLYGRFFINHPALGYLLCLTGIGVVLALMWLRAIEHHREQNFHNLVGIQQNTTDRELSAAAVAIAREMRDFETSR
jgi:hypothetical protein